MTTTHLLIAYVVIAVIVVPHWWETVGIEKILEGDPPWKVVLGGVIVAVFSPLVLVSVVVSALIVLVLPKRPFR